MNPASSFRSGLAARILAVIAVSLPASTGCSSSATSCGDPAGPTESEACFTPPTADAGAGGGGGMASAPTDCPSRSDAAKPLADATFSAIAEVTSDATVKNGQCCYQVLSTPICEGRPYIVDDVARTAAPVRGALASTGCARDDLEVSLRAALAARWTRDGLFEHASIASFGRFALELLAVGAPADLVESAHRAALDEVRHAALCFDLASAYAGEGIAPGPFPFDGRVDVASDLASIAARTAIEGCIGETVAAAVAGERLAVATDPAVRAALAVIAEDEARHAELAWRTVAWAIRTGGPRVKSAVARAFADMGSFASPGPEEAHLPEHGWLGSDALRATAGRAIEEIVRPAARALLAAAPQRVEQAAAFG